MLLIKIDPMNVNVINPLRHLDFLNKFSLRIDWKNKIILDKITKTIKFNI